MATQTVPITLGVLALTAFLAAATQAANTNNNNKPPFTFNVPQPSNSDVVAAQKDAGVASAEYGKATSALNMVVVKLRRDFEASADFKAAAAALKDAQAAYDAARTPVLEALKTKPDYAAAKAAKEKAELDRDAVKNKPDATPEERLAVATGVLNTGSAVTRMEGEALAAEPKVTDARTQLVAAQAKVNELNKQFDDSVKNNADWKAAKATQDQGKTQADAAQARVKEAQAAYAQRVKDWNKQRADAYQQWLRT